MIILVVVAPASLKCQKPEAVSAVTKLYEVGAEREAEEDAQLRTGSDTVSPGRDERGKKKRKAGEEVKTLKSLSSLGEVEDRTPAD